MGNSLPTTNNSLFWKLTWIKHIIIEMAMLADRCIEMRAKCYSTPGSVKRWQGEKWREDNSSQKTRSEKVWHVYFTSAIFEWGYITGNIIVFPSLPFIPPLPLPVRRDSGCACVDKHPVFLVVESSSMSRGVAPLVRATRPCRQSKHLSHMTNNGYGWLQTLTLEFLGRKESISVIVSERSKLAKGQFWVFPCSSLVSKIKGSALKNCL